MFAAGVVSLTWLFVALCCEFCLRCYECGVRCYGGVVVFEFGFRFDFVVIVLLLKVW